jgi:hypothetical protein
MKRITTLLLALTAAAGLTLAGCNKRDDMPAPGAGTTTAPGGTSTTPGGGTTTPGDTSTSPGTTGGSMGTSPATPSASAASQ